MKPTMLALLLIALYSCNGGGDPDYDFPDGPDPEPTENFETVPLAGYPSGLRVYSFDETFDDGEVCKGFYAVADLAANPSLRFNTTLSAPAKTPSEIFSSYGSLGRGTPQIVVNGGYFWSGSSLSLLIADGVVESIENQSVTRKNSDGQSVAVYPLRSAFGQMAGGSFEAHWIYCVADDGNKPYAFPSPLGNDEQTKTFMNSAPTSSTEGGARWQPRNAIGGGPRLVANGVNVSVSSYWGECLEEGGTAGLSRQPRTALGATADGKVVLMVCDGRSMNGSAGYTLSEMADRLSELGVKDAINLDGGGSSTFVGRDGSVLNRPSDSGPSGGIVERKVPTAVVVSLL